MGREKIRHLFNKNHIEIFTVENPEIPIWKTPVIDHKTMASYSYSHNWGGTEEKKYKEVKKVSPLGFYYTKKILIPQKGKDFDGSIKITMVTYPVPGENNTYIQLKYYTHYNDNQIGGEDGLRPWDIYPGDKDFPDHMLDALVKEVTAFFDNAEIGKITEFQKDPWSRHYVNYSDEKKYYKSTNEVKREVFKELFGNPNGPRFQTNEEKILAHGFDLKYSFRKDKEKK